MDTETSPPQPVMEMNRVSVGSLQDQTVLMLQDVNWSVSPGDFWVVGGMHGSGKSDLLNLAAGLMAPQAGTYRLFGHTMPIYGEHQLAHRLRAGVVFDTAKLFHRFTVEENVSLPLRYHYRLSPREAEERVAAVLELAELGPWARHAPGELRRNWQKRAALARALVLKPELLLLDNPLGGMDLRHARWWLAFLKQLSSGHEYMERRPVTLVVTAEDLRPWTNLASCFAILKQKQFVSIGRRSQFSEHSEPLLRELLAEEFPTS